MEAEWCDMLEIPKSSWTLVVQQQTLVGKLWDATQRRFKVFNDLTTQIGMDLLHRQGQSLTGQSRPQFKVPPQLMQNAENVSILTYRALSEIENTDGFKIS